MKIKLDTNNFLVYKINFNLVNIVINYFDFMIFLLL